MSRYDLALGTIPIAFAVSVTVSSIVGLSLVQALVPAAITGILVITDVCYLNPPTTRDDRS